MPNICAPRGADDERCDCSLRPQAADFQLRAPRRLRRAGACVAVLSDPALGHADDLVQVDGGNPRRADFVLAEELHAGRLAERLVVRLYRPHLRRCAGRILEFDPNSRALRHFFDRTRRAHRLRDDLLSRARREPAVRHHADRRVHSLSGFHLSHGARVFVDRSIRLAWLYRRRARDLRSAADDPPVPQLLQLAADRAVQRRAGRRRRDS